MLGAHVRRYDVRHRRRQRHVVRGVGAARQGRPGEGRLQQLGRPRAPDAADGRLGRLGAVRPRRRLRHPLQVRRPRRRRPVAGEGRPDGLPHRGAAADLVGGVRLGLLVERRRVDDAARRGGQRARAPDVGLRAAPRVVEEALRRRDLLLRRARRRAGRLRHRPRLHARRVHAGDGAPVRRLVGLPGDVVLRPDRAVRRPRRLPVPRRPAAPGRHRRDRRLGPRALPQGRVRARALRRHPALRGPQPLARRAPRLGHLRVQLRPQGGPQLPGRQRALLARGVPHRRPPGRRGGLDALPGLLPRGRRVDAQRLRRPREPRGGRSSSRR